MIASGRYGSKTPAQRCPHHVCFPSGSDGIADIPDRQLRANKKHFAAVLSTVNQVTEVGIEA
jgi:hypothetical protein